MTFFKVTLACLLAIGIYNFLDTSMDLYLRGGVYSCAEKQDNPTHIQQQCQKLTKGQWWAK